ncbi:la-related protein 1C isoform X2 [Cynara cardunculus var. scolymus]|uniref:RNA-binding protein Lupus La n=1 Tax=Cynara cardunculus var. scolymus TaxID=59895 RepID=A0A103YGQ1_CYNCS|nr:la-related protein 1C isoform X2 [Cynara cardunculus var. scolymus]KVI08752.1 RNA-binding protein Lupus La [Cynara cardunculus var. scolymus]
MAAMNVQSGDGGLNSPTTQRGVASAWSQIVRGGGGESEVVSPVLVATVGSAPAVPVPAPASPSWSSFQEHASNFSPDWSPSKVVQEAVSSPDDSGTEGQPDGSDNSGGSNASKKPVWNRPSNGVVEVVSPVMGAAWPALGESTKASPKSSSSESLKALSDGPLPPALQVTGNSSPSQKQASANNVNSTSTPNHVAPARQRSMKRGGGISSANVSANGVVSQQPPINQDSVAETLHSTSGKPGTAAEQPSPRDHTHKDSQRGGFGSQSHSGNDHHHQRGSYRRGNGGQHLRDGSYHHNYGGKRDHDRGNQEWNQHSRSFNNRDTHLQSQRGFSRGYIRPSVHTSAPFIPPPMPVPVQSFGNNMMYPDVASPVIYVPGPPPPDSLRAMPFVAPLPPPMYFAVPDPQLHAKIVSQIDYYFSNENLVKDTYLRRNMDEHGWVPISLIAGFKKVLYLTDNVQLILDAMRTSTIVEVQGDKIRRRNDWMRWIMPAAVAAAAHVQYSNPSSPQAVGRSPNHEGLASQLEGVALHEATRVPVETNFSRSNSEEFTGGEETATIEVSGFGHAAAA